MFAALLVSFLLLAGASHHTRTSLGSVWILTLLQHDHGPNNQLQIIIDDDVKWCIERIPPIDVFGQNIRIFLDPVAFFGDFVKMESVSDNMRQSASIFCTNCTIENNTTQHEVIFFNCYSLS